MTRVGVFVWDMQHGQDQGQDFLAHLSGWRDWEPDPVLQDRNDHGAVGIKSNVGLP